MNSKELIVSTSPHIKTSETISKIVGWVIIALMPLTLMSFYLYGFLALKVILLSVLSAVITEAAVQKMRRFPITITDGTAVLTGLLLALTLPPNISWWLPVIGGFIAITLGKQLFGGFGYNVFNPALVARATLLLSWTVQMTSAGWVSPLGKLDGVSGATPLALMKQAQAGTAHLTPHLYVKPLFLANPGGCIGEVSALLILVGAAILFWRKIISWHIPFSYIGTVAIFSYIFKMDVVFNLLAGGLLLGAFFMATDYVTSPITDKAKLVYGFGCGFMTILL
ncbi:MAG: RnfABCDGE type electron transport complex subunit D, partial [Candidatus Subteraquimicrobiales bacterium]|nr:RnfABCDGE type electron transport complex subunit D [Candidatus Subteraquimicrobiales bacterium]